MRSLWQESARTALLRRLGRLSSEAQARWGLMTAAQMLAHLNDAFCLSTGELSARPPRGLLRIPPLNYVVACLLPFPRGAPTAPELLRRAPDPWETEINRLHKNVAAFGRRDPRGPWPDHPIFGRLAGWAWGMLGYRHLDHHLRQFGV
ncbi:MAG: DUF1569 domain-containing protein [Gemmatimonadaceae bacterium]